MSWELEIVDGVAVISMNSNAMNIMNNQFFKDLNGTLDEIEASHGNKPVVLTSSANAFSAGLDINEVLPLFSSKNKDAIKLWYENFKNSILRVFSFERPMIAAVNGHAIAGGLILAMCCDYRFVVDDNSKFGLNEISIGFPLPGSIAEIIKHVLG
ncbi:MAG: enoyl-CoA hydratase/isomerase family protein, partial [Candidatus Dadabacteria bacterium]|nr:enoyl-CoA hydratase/isomerase family protein [Candidatus Dadabacteria bacterium]NIQ15765.1 enoyl-CoA hydratase/isomerase family protein [Candidatus Dadabacteria bacterium]